MGNNNSNESDEYMEVKADDLKDTSIQSINYTAVSFLQAVANGQIKFEICNINKNSSAVRLLKQLKFMPKSFSSSDTDIYFGNLIFQLVVGQNIDLPVTFKIFENVRNADNERIKYEADVYEYITRNILYKKVSPNFVGYVGFGCCNYMPNLVNISDVKIKTKNAIRQFANIPEEQDINTEEIIEQKKDYEYYIRNMKKSISRAQSIILPNSKGFCMLITEQAGNGDYFNTTKAERTLPLGYLIKHPEEFKLSNTEKNNIFFQICFAIEAMYRLGIQHNDLHPYNILIGIFEKRIDMYFKTELNMYSIKTNYIPYIFDWDYSYVKSFGTNIPAKTEELDMYNTLIYNKDLYTFICTCQNSRNYDHYFPVATEIIKQYPDLKTIMNTKETQSIYDVINPGFLDNIIPVDEKKQIYILSGKQVNQIIDKNIFDNFISLSVQIDSNPVYYLMLDHKKAKLTSDQIKEIINTNHPLKKYFDYFKKIHNNFLLKNINVHKDAIKYIIFVDENSDDMLTVSLLKITKQLLFYGHDCRMTFKMDFPKIPEMLDLYYQDNIVDDVSEEYPYVYTMVNE